MNVSIEHPESSVSNCKVFYVTVSGLTMGELLKIAEKNFLQSSFKRKVYLCSLVAIEACRQAGESYDVSVSVPPNSSLALIDGVANNLSLNKKTRMVPNTALNNPSRRNAYTLVGISGTKTWQEYIGSQEDLVQARLNMVREAFANNPNFVFPDMKYTIFP